jgi:hypothetical protein
MSLIYSILLILFILIGLLFAAAIEIKLLFDTKQGLYDVSFKWLYPFLEIEYEIDEATPMITVFLFEKKIYRHAVKFKKKKNKGLIKSVDISDVNITTSYGFNNPAFTGVICGLMNIAKSFIDTKTTQYPDFATTDSYIITNASAKVNAGNTMVNIIKKKLGG